MIFKNVVTLYNHYIKDGSDAWKRTVLAGVQWTEKYIKAIGTDGKLSVVPEITITIPERAGYIEPALFEGSGFTFGLDNLDIVTLGICEKEINDEYSITDLRRDRPNTATIYAAADNTMAARLKHWQVNAK